MAACHIPDTTVFGEDAYSQKAKAEFLSCTKKNEQVNTTNTYIKHQTSKLW